MLIRLGYTEPAKGSASGFASSGDYPEWLKTHDTSATRWQHVASVRPPMVRFWYRSSPRALAPRNFFGSSPGGGMQVSESDPAMTDAGMTSIELDPAGTLVALDAVAPEKNARIDAATTAAPPDWSALFREAGLDIRAFRSTTPEWVSRTGSDATAAWVGPGADASGAELRVEAAAFQSRPVFFRLIGPWTRAPATAMSGQSGTALFVFTLVVGTSLGVMAAGLVLAVRNVKLGRADTHGALNIATGIGILTLTATLLGSDVPNGANWMSLLFLLASWASLKAMLSWGLYVGLEPYARRRWPHMLITWSRLIEGRWRDPLVGRDLLIGSVCGAANLCWHGLHERLLAWIGQPPKLNLGNFWTWLGPRIAAAAELNVTTGAIWLALGFVMLLVLLRLVLRGERLAAVCAVAIFTVPFLQLGVASWFMDFAFWALAAVAWVFVATRFGLVALAAMFITVSGVELSAPSFATGSLALMMAMKVAVGVFGFYTATRGRKATAWLDG